MDDPVRSVGPDVGHGVDDRDPTVPRLSRYEGPGVSGCPVLPLVEGSGGPDTVGVGGWLLSVVVSTDPDGVSRLSK